MSCRPDQARPDYEDDQDDQGDKDDHNDKDDHDYQDDPDDQDDQYDQDDKDEQEGDKNQEGDKKTGWTFIKNAFDNNSRFFSQKYACNKKDRNVWPQGFQIAAVQQSFSQCWWKRPILEGSLIQKPT